MRSAKPRVAVPERACRISDRMTDTPDASQSPGREARASLGLLLTRIAVYPLGFLASVLIARSLGAHDRGLYAFVLLIGNFVLPILNLGFGTAVIYLITNHEYQSRDVACSILGVALLQGSLASAIFGFLWDYGWLGEAGQKVDWDILVLALPIAPAQSVFLIGERLLRGQSRFAAVNFFSLARALGLSIALFVVSWFRLGLSGAIMASLLIDLTAAVVLVATIVYYDRPRIQLHARFIRRAVKYGLKIWFGAMASRATLRLDHFLLGFFADPGALGNYAVAGRLSELVWILPDAVTPVYFNRLAKTKDPAAQAALTARVHRILLWAVGAAAVLGALLGWWLIPILFGDEYVLSRTLLLILLPGSLILVSAKTTTKYFAAVDRPGVSGLMGVIGGLSGATLYLALIPEWTAIGAAAASSVSYAVLSAASYWLYVRGFHPRPGRMFWPDLRDLQWMRQQVRSVRGKPQKRT